MPVASSGGSLSPLSLRHAFVASMSDGRELDRNVSGVRLLQQDDVTTQENVALRTCLENFYDEQVQPLDSRWLEVVKELTESSASARGTSTRFKTGNAKTMRMRDTFAKSMPGDLKRLAVEEEQKLISTYPALFGETAESTSVYSSEKMNAYIELVVKKEIVQGDDLHNMGMSQMELLLEVSSKCSISIWIQGRIVREGIQGLVRDKSKQEKEMDIDVAFVLSLIHI